MNDLLRLRFSPTWVTRFLVYFPVSPGAQQYKY